LFCSITEEEEASLNTSCPTSKISTEEKTIFSFGRSSCCHYLRCKKGERDLTNIDGLGGGKGKRESQLVFAWGVGCEKKKEGKETQHNCK